MNLDRIPYRWGLLIGLTALAVGFFYFGGDLWRLVHDRSALERFVAQLGWFGPLALILLNALQIVIAPIPGYLVQLTAGFLYGPLWGGIWGSCGLLLGSMVAMWLSRTYGRPLAERLVGKTRLDSWDKVTDSTHTLVWFILLASPIGDLPYFLAGLAQVSFWKIALLTLTVRVPSVFVSAAIGAGVLWLTWWQLSLIFLLFGTLLLFFLRYQAPIIAWLDRRVQQRI